MVTRADDEGKAGYQQLCTSAGVQVFPAVQHTWIPRISSHITACLLQAEAMHMTESLNSMSQD